MATPPVPTISPSDIPDGSMEAKMDFLVSKVLAINTDTSKIIENQLQQMQTLTGNVNTISIDVENLKLENTVLKVANVKLTDKIVSLECYYRLNNVILRNVPEEQGSSTVMATVTNILTETMMIPNVSSMLFDDVHRQDLPDSYVKARGQLRPVMTAAKLCGKNASFNGDKLKVDGHSYGMDDIPNLPSHLNQEKACTKRTNYVIIFFGKHSPLSNLHECSLTLDGAQYTGVEQRYQQKKAEWARNDKLAQQIISTTFPARQKYLGDKVKVDDEAWKTTGFD
ncbi:hypothetical protein LSH36_1715g00000 [Paralvinella palmiformis]|uniref:Uncharacterized protein n=1 Tax=Paralvinella palmiformis TaxID=53620 RepID=A0AAD9MQ29_9ANNE|nr:hypothetical protein LSH36_1715g00000 [Paralvinella palmiformis]